MPLYEPGRTATTFTPDRLVVGDHPLITRSGTLLSGQNLTRGALLGRITTGGKLTLSLSASSDGSQTPVAILAEDCDASAADKACLFYEAGEFDQAAMTFGASHTADTVRDALAARSIYLKATMPA